MNRAKVITKKAFSFILCCTLCLCFLSLFASGKVYAQDTEVSTEALPSETAAELEAADKPTIPEPQKDPVPSLNYEESLKSPDVIDTGFASAMDNFLWILFVIVLAVSVIGIVLTSRRK